MNLLKSRVVAKAEPPPPQGEERQALAAAIERRNHLQSAFDATTKALTDLQLADARKAVAQAKDAIETAKTNAAAFLTATIQGDAGDPPMSIKDARTALQEAENRLETLVAVETTLQPQREAQQNSLRFANDKVKQKVWAVVGADPSLRKLLVEYEEMKRLLVQRAQLFNVLLDAIPHEHRHWQATRQYHPKELRDETPPWRAALAELENNSDAPLPAGVI